MERAVLYFNKLIKSLKSEKSKRLEGLKSKKQAGFSLIELLVSISILTTLAAIAIPSYNGYRKHTARTVLDWDGKTVQRAFMACVTNKPFSQCDSLAELGMNVGYNTTEVASAPNFCVVLEKEISGHKFKGCYSVNAKDGSTINQFNLSTCYIDGADNRGNTPNCVANDGIYQPNCDRRVYPVVYCSSNQECVDAGAGSVCSNSGAVILTGTCKSDATCENF